MTSSWHHVMMSLHVSTIAARMQRDDHGGSENFTWTFSTMCWIIFNNKNTFIQVIQQQRQCECQFCKNLQGTSNKNKKIETSIENATRCCHRVVDCCTAYNVRSCFVVTQIVLRHHVTNFTITSRTQPSLECPHGHETSRAPNK
jgi:hypothetical protein